MTLCLGLSTNRGVWIGADSGTTLDEATEICSTPKIWRSNGWLVAVAGNWRAQEIMRYELEFPKNFYNAHKALCLDLNSDLQKAFERNDWTLKQDDKGEIDVTDAYTILAGHKDALFYIDHTGHVEKVKRAAIGTGSEYACGILDASELGSAETRIKKAFTTVSKRYRMIVGPYVIEKA